MKRIKFIQNTLLTSVVPYSLIRNFNDQNDKDFSELNKHKIKHRKNAVITSLII